MANTSAPNLLVSLADDDKLGRVIVRLESFLDFANQVSIAMEDVETDWLHAAAPQAGRQAIIKDRRFDSWLHG